MLPLCDPVCHASSHSGVAMLHCELLYTHVVYFTDFFHRWTRVGPSFALSWVRFLWKNIASVHPIGGLFTNRVSGNDSTIGRVRPSVCFHFIF